MNNLKRLPRAAAVGFTLASIFSPEIASASENKSDIPPVNSEAIARLARNPAEIQKLAKLALAEFEADLKKGPTKVWVFAGVCTLMGARTPNSDQTKTMYIVPNPGLVHVQDPKTGADVSEAVAWDKQTNSYVTGLINVANTNPESHQIYNVQGYNQQFNFFLQGAQLVVGNVTFSSEHDQIVTTNGETAIMDVLGIGESENLGTFSRSSTVKAICSQTTVNPPNFEPTHVAT